MTNRNYWLIKSEPSTYSFSDLERDQKTNWNGIRNYQARNYLRTVNKGDQLLVYHSGSDKAVVGIAEALGKPYPEVAGEDWVQLDIAPVEKLKSPVPLSVIKKEPPLKGILLIKQSRLSVMPVTKVEFDTICKLGQA
jgi:predicted RNA-binding protein with PUA-like domain